MLGGAQLAFRGGLSRPELLVDGGWNEGVFEKSSCICMLLFERINPEVSALEVSLVGDSDLARSVIAKSVSSTHPHHPAMASQ